MTPPRRETPYYYRVLSGLTLEWQPLARVEEHAGFPATAHPTRRRYLERAVSLGHAVKRRLGCRDQYILTGLGECYLDEAFEVYGPPPRLGALFDD